MIQFLPALLLLLMQGSLDGDALEGRVQQLWLARLTGHSAQLDQAVVEDAICTLLKAAETPAQPDEIVAAIRIILDEVSTRDPRRPDASPRDGPLA